MEKAESGPPKHPSAEKPAERLPSRLETLGQFYRLMNVTRDARRIAVRALTDKKPVADAIGELLKCVLALLRGLPKEQNTAAGERFLLASDDGKKNLPLNLDYELNELEKDLFFLRCSRSAFIDQLAARTQGFVDELEITAAYLNPENEPLFLVADRDGTVNNYCGRYLSSIQSIYNAVFLQEFAVRAGHAIILTSAPLTPNGLLDVSVSDPRFFILAGSKGRDFLDRQGSRHQFPIAPEQQLVLDGFNRSLSGLLSDRENEIFSLIGSGLQFKFGQTTVAYQDVFQSIEPDRANRFAAAVRDLVDRFNAGNRNLLIEDTGKDLEIMLSDAAGGKEFDKGDGLAFIDHTLGRPLAGRRALVCGDTASDIPMLLVALEHAAAVKAVFVTTDEALKADVRRVSRDVCFVSSPDVLVAALADYGKKGQV